MIGIQTGMVMQRNEMDVAQVLLQDIAQIHCAYYEGTSEGVLEWKLADNGWLLTGLPVGGPYTVTINEEMFTDIYVGDVWLLAGQSNMEGVGCLTPEDREFAGETDVRAFDMQDHWVVARHRLHRPWLAVDKVHTQVLPCNPGSNPEERGVGPGLAFAQHMKLATGVPQGVICCAHGGTTLEQWDPQLRSKGPDQSLFAAMLRRFAVNGSHVRGLFWYQGCSEAMGGRIEKFTEDTAHLFEVVRSECGNIPIVQVQVGNVTVGEKPGWDHAWSSVREQQRRMKQTVTMLDTISAVGMETDDAIHLSSASQQKIGRAAADSMCALLNITGGMPTPEYRNHRLFPAHRDGHTVIELTYDHIFGELEAEGRPAGFEIGNTPEKPLKHWVSKVSVKGCYVYVQVPRTMEQLKGWYLFYGYGVNPYCNITDAHGRRIPAMGPIAIEIEQEET